MDRAHDSAARSPLQRLAVLVRHKRRALGLNKRQGAETCDLAYMTYMRVEEGRPVRDATYTKVERRYGFVPGSCDAVLNGAEAIALRDGGTLAAGGATTPFPLQGLEGEIRRAVEETAIVVRPDMPIGEVRRIAEGIVEHLRHAGALRNGDGNSRHSHGRSN